ncbi:MAG TPA: CoA pyrophosphatase [Candidatus Limnocylindria bacterium]|nr:CoA pyrophosphatase [Candidatus Limnocylindria bacterium]
MRFEAVEGRLAHLPTHLPPAPPELQPVLLPAADGRVPSLKWPAEPRREAAVLLLIYPDKTGQAVVVLTERSAGGQRHSGQISLPGGAIERTDSSTEEAALREAREEISLERESSGLRLVGRLPPFDVRVSGFLVHPVLATAPARPRLRRDSREVAAIVHAPLSAFLPGAPIELVSEERDGLALRYGAYRVGRHIVWGATANILGRFGAFLAGG